MCSVLPLLPSSYCLVMITDPFSKVNNPPSCKFWIKNVCVHLFFEIAPGVPSFPIFHPIWSKWVYSWRRRQFRIHRNKAGVVRASCIHGIIYHKPKPGGIKKVKREKRQARKCFLVPWRAIIEIITLSVAAHFLFVFFWFIAGPEGLDARGYSQTYRHCLPFNKHF